MKKNIFTKLIKATAMVLTAAIVITGFGVSAPAGVQAATMTFDEWKEHGDVYTGDNVHFNHYKVSTTVGDIYRAYLFDVFNADGAVWKSSKPSVATVKGLKPADRITVIQGKVDPSSTVMVADVTCKKAGTTTISVKVNGKTYKFKLTVKKSDLNYTKKTLRKGESFWLNPKHGQPETYFSYNDKIAKVNASGKIEAVGKGTTKIMCRTNKGKTYYCTLTVKSGKKTKCKHSWAKTNRVQITYKSVFYEGCNQCGECFLNHWESSIHSAALKGNHSGSHWVGGGSSMYGLRFGTNPKNNYQPCDYYCKKCGATK